MRDTYYEKLKIEKLSKLVPLDLLDCVRAKIEKNMYLYFELCNSDRSENIRPTVDEVIFVLPAEDIEYFIKEAIASNALDY